VLGDRAARGGHRPPVGGRACEGGHGHLIGFRPAGL
jgi:hypothetical protein